ERPELRTPAGAGASADPRRIGPGHAAALLEHLEILGDPVALLHGPARALLHHPIELLLAELDGTAAAHAARHRVVERHRDRLEVRPHLLHGHIAAQQPDPAVDVVAH